MPYQDWTRLGQFVRERRARRGFKTQRALADAMEVTSKVVNNIELGKKRGYSPATIAALELMLGWDSGSVRSVLEGGEPHLTPTLQPRRVNERRPEEDLWEEWSELHSRALNVEIKYGRLRGLSPSAARDELRDTFVMAQQGKEARPWAPPWEEPSDEAGEPADDEREVVSFPHKRLVDQARVTPDLTRHAAYRGDSEGRRRRREQDEAAELPDEPEGP
jgi:transcriptional regulator with XRE-family HTH domain